MSRSCPSSRSPGSRPSSSCRPIAPPAAPSSTAARRPRATSLLPHSDRRWPARGSWSSARPSRRCHAPCRADHAYRILRRALVDARSRQTAARRRCGPARLRSTCPPSRPWFVARFRRRAAVVARERDVRLVPQRASSHRGSLDLDLRARHRSTADRSSSCPDAAAVPSRRPRRRSQQPRSASGPSDQRP